MRLLTPLAFLALVACGGDSDDDTSGGTLTDTGSTTTGSGSATGTTVGGTAAITGTVSDSSGAPLANVGIRFCRGLVCKFGETDAAGAYGFEEIPADWHSLEMVPTDDAFATSLIPVTFSEYETRTVNVVLPQSDAAVPLGAPAEVELGTGLLITVGDGDLEPPAFVDPATEASGVLLTPDQYVPTDGLTGTSVAQWYLAPFDHKSADGQPIRIDGAALGLTGSSYTAWVGDYKTSAWIEIGTFTDGDGDQIFTTDGTLGVFSTIVLLEP